MSNKRRVFIALYFLQGITKPPNQRALGERPAFHWGVVLQDKNERDLCATMDVKLEDAYTNIPGSGGWKYHYHPDARLGRSRPLIGMIMVGKVPASMTAEQVDQILRGVPVPRENMESQETCRTWVMEAIRRLQDAACVEQFDAEKFVVDAMRQGDELFATNPVLAGQVRRANYTSRPM